MVIGNGMIAKRFSAYANDDQWLIFASGVSHSLSIKEEEFQREQVLLEKTVQDAGAKTLVYFSTCSIYDPSMQRSAYVLHKLRMEDLIKNQAASWIIFRVSNPVGITNNKHTVLNYFVAHICTQTFFTVWKNASRNLLDIDDMYRICERVMHSDLYSNHILNIANPENYPAPEIVGAVENHFNIKGHFEVLEKGNSPQVDTTAIQPFFDELDIEFGQHYMKRLLEKYFPTT